MPVDEVGRVVALSGARPLHPQELVMSEMLEGWRRQQVHQVRLSVPAILPDGATSLESEAVLGSPTTLAGRTRRCNCRECGGQRPGTRSPTARA